MRSWCAKLMDEPPKPRSQMTKKDKALTIISAIVDATIILLLVYTLLVNSCQICYSTSAGANTFTQCKNMADIMENGVPSEMIRVYTQDEQTKEGLVNITELS